MALSRQTTADGLKVAATGWLTKRGFSSHVELGLTLLGKRRADVIGVNLKSEVVIIEVKSSVSDFRTDTKWHTYLPFCDRFYFAVTASVWEKLKPDLVVEPRVGVLVLDPSTGWLAVKRVVKKDPQAVDPSPELRLSLITRLAWRGGKSKRNSRRTRVHL